jgi:hypothetical protein
MLKKNSDQEGIIRRDAASSINMWGFRISEEVPTFRKKTRITQGWRNNY